MNGSPFSEDVIRKHYGDSVVMRSQELREYPEEGGEKTLSPKAEDAFIKLLISGALTTIALICFAIPNLFLTSDGSLTLSWYFPGEDAVILVIGEEETECYLRALKKCEKFKNEDIEGLKKFMFESDDAYSSLRKNK